MNFFNNPEYNSIKILLVVILVAGAGYFAFNYMNGNALGGKGQVIAIKTATTTPAPQENCYSVQDSGSGNCSVHPANCGAASQSGTWATCHSKDGDSACCCTSTTDCYDSGGDLVVPVTGSSTGYINAATRAATFKALGQGVTPNGTLTSPSISAGAQSTQKVSQ